MSILIRDMEMPVIDLEWTIRHGADGKWYAIDTNAETSDGEWHEIISVPQHGRCIDVDALIKELAIDDLDDHNGATLLMAVFLEVLKATPTIIPASKEGEL